MSINRLPSELLVQVLSGLDVNDLLKCRLVNPLWKATIESHIRINSLTVFFYQLPRRSDWNFFQITKLHAERADSLTVKVNLYERFFVFTPQLMEPNHRFVIRNRNFRSVAFTQN